MKADGGRAFFLLSSPAGEGKKGAAGEREGAENLKPVVTGRWLVSDEKRGGLKALDKRRNYY
eukprot:scaffold62304_cov23-Tisochrysis_lutea.AAC.1